MWPLVMLGLALAQDPQYQDPQAYLDPTLPPASQPRAVIPPTLPLGEPIPVYRVDQCVGAVVGGVCHGTIIDTQPQVHCYGTMLDGAGCIGPQF